MVDSVRSVDFLPEIFQTPVNEQFLSATLDQLIQEPAFKKSQGFIGQQVGPGINANDGYVTEPTATRRNYQLEPGVIQVNPANTHQVVDAITYPGINDALAVAGANVTNPSSLYKSDYYAWDPFVDFDKYINYAQYYWLPFGPLPISVTTGGVATLEDFTVTRNNGYYTFSGIAGNNPNITLARGGSYNFVVAQNEQAAVQYRVTNNGTANWNIDYAANPTLTLTRGNTYTFNLTQSAPLAFYIKTQVSLGTVNLYSSGVNNNGASTGLITFTVPQDAPDTLYYCNDVEFNLQGTFNIINATPGSGPGFWIQTDPGVNGRIPATPNISSRDVLGVVNNGTDLGTVTFNTPASTAQNFFYNMPIIGPVANQALGTVDLVTDLAFDSINGQTVVDFMLENPTGIDGTTNLDTRTLIFAGSNNVDPALYNVWRINYVDGVINLTLAFTVDNLTKCTILFGTKYSNTNWYKNADSVFEQMPLLTATQDILYYQDGTDPTIFGTITLVDQTTAILDINHILGNKIYTSPNGVTFTNGMIVTFNSPTYPSSYEGNSYFVEGVGTAITLSLTRDFITPETYTDNATTPFSSLLFDQSPFDGTLNAPLVPDYITINRSAINQNPWSRSNRWFHSDVINASAKYNNTVPVYDNTFIARRPILEFRGGLRLYDFGTDALPPVNIINFDQPDALYTVNGSIGFSTDGYTLLDGSTIIFAGDLDPLVRNKIYQVSFVVPDTVPPLIAEPIINLVPIATVLQDQNTVCIDGSTLQGISYGYSGTEWIRLQQKSSVNQPPKFDVYDTNGYSFGNRDIYPSSTFTGSSLLSYAIGNGATDAVLGFPLVYLNLTNIGDIKFENNFYNDTFNYTIDNVGYTTNISTGFVYEYSNRVTFKKDIGWQPAVTQSQIRQQFQFVYDGSPLQLDILVNENTVVPAVQVFINATFQESYNYTVTRNTVDNTTTITWLTTYVPGDLIEIQVLSDQTSAVGFYQVPINLENNPFNGNSQYFTLGTARNHYSTIAENLLGLSGPVIGPNNTRDLGNIVPYGLQILQQSAPLTLAGYFLRNAEFNIFEALDYNSREYIKFKSQLLNTVVTNDWGNQTTAQILDSAMLIMNAGDTKLSPFYWSDMLPSGTVYVSNSYTVSAITTNGFNTVQSYDFTTSNYLGLLVYVNGVLLTRNLEYTVSTDTPTLVILAPLNVGDVVVINEYNDTTANYVPNTPTKLGLYPKFRPEFYLDPDYINPTFVIQGHDGSTTVAFGDIRDQILLEFETRIYNNLKNDGNPVPLTAEDVIPGYFRTTDYSNTTITQILGEDFLSWVGYNKLDYTAQDYLANNPFTYNYTGDGIRIVNGQISNVNETALVQGAWRGIYRYFYDTFTPNLTPWEMLGFSEQPVWWTDRYGPVPYTSDNLVLWGDLEAGYVANPVAPYIDPRYVRPGLTNVIPVDEQGQLLPPLESVIGVYDANNFKRSWKVGDGGPVESSWWMSSSYPFAVMRLLALTKPAEFFSLFADRDLYRYNIELEQYLYNGRYRLDGSGLQIYGNGVSKASYINWIVDYNQQRGLNSTDILTTDLSNLDVRLCYRMAAWTADNYLKISLEKSSPESQNQSLYIPPESYNLLVYKDQPYGRITYSSVIVETVAGGYAVYGYSGYNPYFPVQVSLPNGILQTISAGGATVSVPAQYSDSVAYIPYGYVFSNITMVVDFLLSYGQYLSNQGFVFTQIENGLIINWNQMAQEFLYYAEQGWSEGTIINLNPSATQLTVYQVGAVVDDIISYSPANQLLDQNRQTFATRDLVIQRSGDTFTIQPAPSTSQTISFLDLKFTDYENMIVFDNVDIFNDLIYDPITAARQNRLYLEAFNSTEWDGTLNAKGFILNYNNVEPWSSTRRYTKGEIVRYKNNYWQAAGLVQPKAQFDYNDWYKSNYAMIDQGLLPNLANKADQLANTYSTQTANLNSDNDLLAYNLIGFQPRQYMVDLELDDVSQINLYQQFIKTKGSLRAAELLTRANLGKETGQYNIYEEWGVLVGTYGANYNRSYFEILLNEADLTSNPSTVQIIYPGETSQADQTVQLGNLWSSSYNINTANILPVITSLVSNTALPSAGYVSLDDVDITVFSLDDPSNIASEISTIGTGTSIWVAKDNSYNWNVYRCTQVAGQILQITDNLNSTSLLTLSQTTGLSVGDLIIVRYFATGIDGVYRVLSVPSLNTVVIAHSFTSTSQTTIYSNGNGLVWRLQTQRVAQASDVASLPYSQELFSGAKAWVDNNGNGQWEVLEKTAPFTQNGILQPNSLVEQANFGTSVTQSYNSGTLMIGTPGIGSGQVETFYRSTDGTYRTGVSLTINATDTFGFGQKVTYGNNTWAAAGAPASNGNKGYTTVLYQDPATNEFRINQLLTSPEYYLNNLQFGTAIALSYDERWLYIGGPGHNRVYAYTRVDQQAQSVEYITDGVTVFYNWSDSIQVNYQAPAQLLVTLNNRDLTYQVDYQVNSNSIQLVTQLPPGQLLRITRRVAVNLIGNGTRVGFNLTGYLYTITDIDSFTVYVDGFLQRPSIDYIYNSGNLEDLVTLNGQYINTDSSEQVVVTTPDTGLVFAVAPRAGASIDVITSTYWALVNVLETGSLGLADDAGFGSSLVTSTDGQTLIVGAKNDQTVDSNGNIVTHAGSTYVYDRSVIRYVVNNTAQLIYTLPGTVSTPVQVTLNKTVLTNTANYLNGQFTVSGNNIILSSSVYLALGDELEISTNQFQLVQKLSANNPASESQFGYSVAMSSNNTTVYVGAPNASTASTNCGAVQSLVDQSRLYGVIVSNVANPTLTAGDTIRINNIEIAVPASPDNTISGLARAINPGPYLSTTQYHTGNRVIYQNLCYTALTTSTNKTPADNPSFWQLSFNIPNVSASLTNDLTFVADGTTKIYDVGAIYSATVFGPSGPNTVVYVAGVLQTYGVDYTYDNTTQQILFVTAPLGGKIILVVSGRLVLNVINPKATAYSQLTVLPGSNGTAFANLGFTSWIYTQTIYSPNPVNSGRFGHSLAVNAPASNLVVGSPNGNVYEIMPFDGGETIFDKNSTTFSNLVINSGVVYTFDLLESANPSATNPGQLVFGQQVYNNTLTQGDGFGTSVSFTEGQLIAGAPGADLGSANQTNYGTATVLDNLLGLPAWQVIHQQEPVVNVELLNSVYSFDKILSSTQTYYDFIDPLQGKILGVAQQNIDYIGAVDPASYNYGTVHNNGTTWAAGHVGQIWWDTNLVRFINPNQNDIIYASRQWGQTFPGSRVDIYQWIESSVTPANYAGPGTPLSTTSYSVGSALGPNGLFSTTYYYWVRNIPTVYNNKTLSTTAIASYIQYPINSGIAYIGALNSSTIALYNAVPNLVSANNTVLHVEYDQQAAGSQNNIHQEYAFITDGRPHSFLNNTLYRKLQDSLCGEDILGNPVPDPFLSPGQRYGVEFRPRQSMFSDRFAALENYLTRVNSILAQYPITEIRSFNLLNSSEALPSSVTATATVCSISGNVLTVGGDLAGEFVVGMTLTGNGLPSFVTINGYGNAGTYILNTSLYLTNVSITGTNGYNQQVDSYEVLTYQNLYIVPLGYLFLVTSDSTQNGRWTVYEVALDATGLKRETNLIRIQNYDTPLYWNHIDWYLPGYNSATQPVAQVQNTGDLLSLSLSQAPVGSSVRVTNYNGGMWEIYLRTTTAGTISDWTRVGLQQGTIAFSETLWNYALGKYGFDAQVFDAQYFDQEPVVETRNIIQAINEELFIDDLLIFRNQCLILLFNFVYSEFTAPSWLVKSSFIEVDHTLRALLPYQLYQKDNQTFVEDYLNEIKPYHVQTLAFNLIYDGIDTYSGEVSDFDLPAYWNTDLVIPQFTSPVLTPYTLSGSLVESTVSNEASNAAVWSQWPWSDWFNNYTLKIDLVEIVNGGSGYTVPPVVVVTGNCTEQATMAAVINSAGQVVAVNVLTPGSGYVTNATISFTGGNGLGAQAVAVMNNSLVRSFKTTIKYDRYQYASAIHEWQAGITYHTGDLVRYFDVVWSANSTLNQSYFDPAFWSLVPANQLSGVDRTMGFYVPGVNMPGLSLPLLINGVSYPGVQVTAPTFNQNTGFDVGNYNINPFDNISYDASGQPTYDPSILDARYSSSYLDLYLGTRPTDINVDGGGYIDTFSSYAPEELVPGSEFDTLDMRVYTTPGDDWQQRGHGFLEVLEKFVFDPLTPTVSFAGMAAYPAQVRVSNQTQQTDLVLDTGYTVDWPNQQITIVGNATAGDTIVISVFEIGGGNQIYKNIYNGANFNGNTYSYTVIPVEYYQANGVKNIQELVIFVNGGVPLINVEIWNYLNSYNIDNIVFDTVTGAFYQAVQYVPVRTAITDSSYWTQINTAGYYAYSPFGVNQTEVFFSTLYTSADFVSLYAIAPTTINEVTTDYSWSTPQTQIITATGATSYTLDNSLAYSNPSNLIVSVNGARARLGGGINYTGDGTIASFLLPPRLGVDPSTINASAVSVYVNSEPVASTQWSLSPLGPIAVNGAVGNGAVARLTFANQPVPPYLPNEQITVSGLTGTGSGYNGTYTVISCTVSSVFFGSSYSGTYVSGGNIVGSTKYVTFSTVPVAGSRIQVYALANPQAIVSDGVLTFVSGAGLVPPAGSTITVTSWNDTRQQAILTQLFSGPVVAGITVSQGFDETPFDPNYIQSVQYSSNPGPFEAGSLKANYLYQIYITGNTDWTLCGAADNNPGTIFQALGPGSGTGLAYAVDLVRSTDTDAYNNSSGSYDFTTGQTVQVNDIDLGNIITDPDRLWVYFNGRRLFNGSGFTLDGTKLNLNTGVMGPTDQVIVTQFTNFVVPEAMEFRIFQDMRGVQATYRMTPDTTSTTTQAVAQTDDVIHVANAAALSAPDLAADIWGVVTIDAERIMYRYRDITANTISGLLRGTAGTANAPHAAGATVYSMGPSQLLYAQYQNHVVSNTTLANGSQTVFVADDVNVSDLTTTEQSEAVQVYVGGLYLQTGYTLTSADPATVTFDTAPPAGVDVTILVQRGSTWYAPGNATASNGNPLQITDTTPARFLRGL